MARITPKTNWVASDIPVATDFNRIENNSEQAFTELDAEVANRTAAINAETANRTAAINAETANRTAAINAEESARIAGDNALNASKAPIPKSTAGIGRIIGINANFVFDTWFVSFPEPGTWVLLTRGNITNSGATVAAVPSGGLYPCWKIAE